MALSNRRAPTLEDELDILHTETKEEAEHDQLMNELYNPPTDPDLAPMWDDPDWFM